MEPASFTCPVSGYPALNEPARSPRTGSGSYEICPSCRFQFGVTDDDRGYSYVEWRQLWILRGMPWDNADVGGETEPPPDGWDPRQQLDSLLRSSE